MMGKDFENPWGKVAPKSGRVKMVSELIDSTVMPGIQGGPLMHIIAAKAVAFGEALRPEFKQYSKSIVNNAKVMADEFLKLGYELVSGGTDTHLMLVDLREKLPDNTGKEVAVWMEKAGMIANHNGIPKDPRPPMPVSYTHLTLPTILLE